MARSGQVILSCLLLSVTCFIGGQAAQAALYSSPKPPHVIFRDVITSIKEGGAVVPGVVGRLVSVVLLHPLDSLKTRVQTISTASRRTAEVAVFRGGSPMQGIFPAMLGHVPNGLFTCIGYEMWREILRENAPSLPFRAKVMISAFMGDLTGHLWLTPMEVLKVQIQSGRHQNFPAAFAAAARTGPGAFFQGYAAQVARDVPFRALQVLAAPKTASDRRVLRFAYTRQYNFCCFRRTPSPALRPS
jgi:hypothetical protein